MGDWSEGGSPAAAATAGGSDASAPRPPIDRTPTEDEIVKQNNVALQQLANMMPGGLKL